MGERGPDSSAQVYYNLRLTGKTQVYCILGYPVKHSLSPLFQNLFFSSLSLDAVYVPFEVKPEDLKHAIKGLIALGIKGANITLPHKEKVLGYVDRLDYHVEKIGSANTLKIEEGNVHAYNTDWIGFIRALKELFPSDLPRGVLLLGAGGSARAILYALKHLGCTVYIYNRTQEKAISLSQHFGAQVVGKPEDVLREVNLIVNTTSVGLKDDEPQLFDYDLLSPEVSVVDIIYRETPLIRKAKQRGCKYQTGLEMLLYQGAESFKIWTGTEVSEDLLELAKEELKRASGL